MKAIDTNVLVRYLVQDNPLQSRKAEAYIDGAAEAAEQILIGNIVLCETVWVLTSAYGYAKEHVVAVLEKLLQSNTFEFEDKDVIWSAFHDYRSTKADFADCLMGQLHQRLGCEPTVTFDTSLRKLSTFKVF